MNKILLQCDNLCKRYQEGNVQTDGGGGIEAAQQMQQGTFAGAGGTDDGHHLAFINAEATTCANAIRKAMCKPMSCTMSASALMKAR
jgi:hypothetical protein